MFIYIKGNLLLDHEIFFLLYLQESPILWTTVLAKVQQGSFPAVRFHQPHQQTILNSTSVSPAAPPLSSPPSASRVVPLRTPSTSKVMDSAQLSVRMKSTLGTTSVWSLLPQPIRFPVTLILQMLLK